MNTTVKTTCPCCGKEIMVNPNKDDLCSKCGQKLYFSDGEIREMKQELEDSNKTDGEVLREMLKYQRLTYSRLGWLTFIGILTLIDCIAVVIGILFIFK